MSTLYLVRHGQARFGAADYDQLSPLGRQQCLALGEWFAARGLRFEAVLRGRLKRHAQSLQAIGEGHGKLPAALEWPGLDEYDSDALIAGLPPGPPPPTEPADAWRTHFRRLRLALELWTAGEITPAGMPRFADFSAGVAAALEHVRLQHRGPVLLVSSGGPIATAVQQVLGLPATAMVGLNLHIRNSALTEFRYTPRRHTLLSFNHLPHLAGPGRGDWETYA